MHQLINFWDKVMRVLELFKGTGSVGKQFPDDDKNQLIIITKKYG
jgi:hypothetical protein